MSQNEKMTGIQIPIGPLPDPWRNQPVVVHVPREVAFNYDKLQKITKDVLGKLGCSECHSGRVLDFRIIEEFAVNPKTFEVTEVFDLRR